MGRLTFHHRPFASRNLSCVARGLPSSARSMCPPLSHGPRSRAVAPTPTPTPTPTPPVAWLAVVGCGPWGLNHVSTAAAMGALLAVVDVDEAAHGRARAAAGDARLAAYTSLGAMLDGAGAGLRAVVVATDVRGHAGVVSEALVAGLDVFVEKPMCGSVAQAEAVVEMWRETGRVVMVGHLLRYGRPHALALGLVRAGAIGRVRRVKGVRRNFGTVRTGENVLWSLCPHDVSVALAVCGGGLPRMVRASGQRFVEESGQEDFVDVEMEYWGGVKVRLEASWMHPGKERRMVIYGEDGFVVVNEAGFGAPVVQMWKTAVRKGGGDGRVAITKEACEVRADAFPDAFARLPNKEWTPLRAELEHFRECCFGERDAPDTDADEGLRVVRVLEAATTSMRRQGGDWVMLSDGAEGAAAAAAVDPVVAGRPVAPPDDEDRGGGGDRRQYQTGVLRPDRGGVALPDEPDDARPEYANEDDIRSDLIQAALLNEDAFAFDGGGRGRGGDATHVPLDCGGPSELPLEGGFARLPPSDAPAPAGASSAPFIHPTAVVDAGAIIGHRAKVWHFVHVQAGARIGAGTSLGQNVHVAARAVLGDNVRVQNNVSIFDRVTIGHHVFLGPSCVFTNVRRPRAAFPTPPDHYEETVVGDGATIGANAVVVCGVTIGANAMVGAGAVVTNDVQPHALVVGNPAAHVGWVGTTGVKLQVVQGSASSRASYVCPDTREGYLEVDGQLLLD